MAWKEEGGPKGLASPQDSNEKAPKKTALPFHCHTVLLLEIIIIGIHVGVGQEVSPPKITDPMGQH